MFIEVHCVTKNKNGTRTIQDRELINTDCIFDLFPHKNETIIIFKRGTFKRKLYYLAVAESYDVLKKALCSKGGE